MSSPESTGFVALLPAKQIEAEREDSLIGEGEGEGEEEEEEEKGALRRGRGGSKWGQ